MTCAVVLCFSLLFIACSSDHGTTVTDCPSYTVTPDGGVTGFSKVGEWRSDAFCATYCTADYPVCGLVSANTVKCQKGCA